MVSILSIICIVSVVSMVSIVFIVFTISMVSIVSIIFIISIVSIVCIVSRPSSRHRRAVAPGLRRHRQAVTVLHPTGYRAVVCHRRTQWTLGSASRTFSSKKICQQLITFHRTRVFTADDDGDDDCDEQYSFK